MLKVTESDKVWRIIRSNKVIDRKYSGGASNTVNRIVCQSSKKPPEYSGLGDTTVRSFGNRYSGIKETAIPVLETNHIVP